MNRYGTVLLLALAACASVAPGFHDAAPVNDPTMASCIWSKRYNMPVVYEESDFIRGYFAPTNPAAYAQAIPSQFTAPPRPLIRVSVIDYYGMENGPIYLETEVSVLVLHKGQPGWFVLTMPVTDGDACAAGRNWLGTPKVMRRITLERGADRYVGTSYARGGRTPEFTLDVSVREPDSAARGVLHLASPLPDYYVLGMRVLTVGGLRRPVDEMATLAPAIWKVRLGEARLDFPAEADGLLQRLGVGQPLVAYWAQMRYRYSIKPR